LEVLSRRVSGAPQARLYLGLYHKYGRAPFLAIFDKLRQAGKGEEDLFRVYAQLHSSLREEGHLRSWFTDQVLHPHESQHTLAQIVPRLQELGFRLESTSVNGFAPFASTETLYEQEKGLEAISYQRNVIEHRYYPGFFTVCAARR